MLVSLPFLYWWLFSLLLVFLVNIISGSVWCVYICMYNLCMYVRCWYMITNHSDIFQASPGSISKPCRTSFIIYSTRIFIRNYVSNFHTSWLYKVRLILNTQQLRLIHSDQGTWIGVKLKPTRFFYSQVLIQTMSIFVKNWTWCSVKYKHFTYQKFSYVASLWSDLLSIRNFTSIHTIHERWLLFRTKINSKQESQPLKYTKWTLKKN